MGLWCFVWNLFFIICKGKYQNLGAWGKFPERGSCILHIFENFISENYIFILCGNLLLCENAFHNKNCLKSFDFKVSFVYTFNLLRTPFGTFAHNFCFFWQTYDFLQSLLILEWPGPSPGYSSRGGQKNRRGATFQKYCIGCMEQPRGQTWSGGHRFQMGRAGTTGAPAGDGPDSD